MPSSGTPDLLSQISSLTRLGPVTLMTGRYDDRCRCLLGPRCNRPGEHTMVGRYWMDASRSPQVVAARYAHHRPCGLAVLLGTGDAVLQVPEHLRPALVDHLNGRGLTPPTVHGPRCSWVWIAAPVGHRHRRRAVLPQPVELTAIGPGGWVPVPPTTLGPDTMPLTWGYPPTGDSLTPRYTNVLARHLLAARSRHLA